jgi:Protein of unknown function (DUF4058)
MPMHDWSKVTPNEYRDFHGLWIYAIRKRLNKELLPPGYYATAEQVIVPYGADVLTLDSPLPREGKRGSGGTALATKPKDRAWELAVEEKIRPRRRVVIRHNSGQDIIAVVELVSPANKRSKAGFRAFVSKSLDYLYSGIHLLLIDPFPPGKSDPDGMHAVIWKRYGQKPKPRPAARPLTAVSYSAGKPVAVYLKAFSLGETVPAMPLFLTPATAVTVPLETTYEDAWDDVPDPIRDRLLA